MTNWLIKTFIKNYGDAENAGVRASYGTLSGAVGILCNIFLFTIKLIAGIVAGSISVIADAINNLSDASTSIVSYIGFKLSGRPADAEHPYGHGRYEYVAGFFVVIMIIVVGIELMRESVVKIINPTDVNYTVWSFVIIGVSVLLKLWLLLFNKKLGKKINSETLLAAAKDSRNDVLSTLAVLIGALAVYFWGINIDGYLGAAVAVFIIVSGIFTAKGTLDLMIGRAPSAETIENIRGKIMSYDGVVGTHELMVHDYGPERLFASVHVEMAEENGELENHRIIEAIERDFLKKYGTHLIIHYDLVPSKNSELGDLRSCILSQTARLDPRITIHDLKISGEKITLCCIVPQDVKIGDREITSFITSIIEEKYPDYICGIVIDRSFAALPHKEDESAD